MMAILAVTGCEYPLDETTSYTTSLAVSLKNIGDRSVPTKMTQEITQTKPSGNVFRGIEEVVVIPFRTMGRDSVKNDDARIGHIGLKDPGIRGFFDATANPGLVNGNNSHLYEGVKIPNGMNRVLAYGKAIDNGSVSSKEGLHRNGSLLPSSLDDPATAGDISFSLMPILGTIPGEDDVEVNEIDVIDESIDRLIDALNEVAIALRHSSVPVISSILDTIKRENQILACSYLTFDYFARDIVYRMQQAGTTDISVLEAIRQLNTVLGQVGSSFPASYGIPEGSFGFWWNGDRFVRLINNVNIALIDPAAYCYPPSLWYFTNSPIRTSNETDIVNQYTEINAKWAENILDAYYIDGPMVSSESRSVAIENQLQYGVALLALSLGECEATNAAGCPLTGIIIGDQKDVDFNFNPKLSSASRYVYDNVVSGLSLGSTESTVETLLLQTRAGANQKIVHFALEFKNTTKNILHCQQGDIFPDAKFYLAGELDPEADGVSQPDGEVLSSVFMKDHKTLVTVKVKSLNGAYNTIPDLRDLQLEMGIEAEMKWDPITPQSVKLKM